MAHSIVAGGPLLRLKNGYAQDDAIEDTAKLEREPCVQLNLTGTGYGVVPTSRT
jgi:hypothetical protein